MEHTKKMILISPDAINRIHVQRNESIKDDPISKLDKDMREVLESNANDIDKWKMYQQVLQRYLHFVNNLRKPVEIPVLNEVEQSDGINNQMNVADIIKMVPKTFRNKANILLNYLRNEQGAIEWDNKGTVTIRNKLIPNSNIVDLVNETLKTKKSTDSVGLLDFATLLQELNVPLEIVGNKTLKQYIQEHNRAGSSSMLERKAERKQKEEKEEEREKKEAFPEPLPKWKRLKR